MIVMVGFNPASEPRFQARTSSQCWCPRRPGATERAFWLQRTLRSATPDLFGLNFLGRLLCPWRKDSVKGWRPVRLKEAISEYVQLGSHRLPEHLNELPHAKCNSRSGPQNGLRVAVKKTHLWSAQKYWTRSRQSSAGFSVVVSPPKVGEAERSWQLPFPHVWSRWVHNALKCRFVVANAKTAKCCKPVTRYPQKIIQITLNLVDICSQLQDLTWEVNNSSLSPPFKIPHLSIIGSPRRCAQWHLAAKHPTISYQLPWRLKLIHVSSMDLDGINGHTMAYWRPLLLRPQRQYWIQGRCHFFTLPFTMLCQMQGDAWSGLGYCRHHSGNWLGILRSVFFQMQRRPHDVIFNILRALLLWQKADSLQDGHKIIKKRSELIIREHIWHIPTSLDFMLPHAAISLLVASHFAWWLWWIWVVCRSRFSSLAIARTVCKGLQAANSEFVTTVHHPSISKSSHLAQYQLMSTHLPQILETEYVSASFDLRIPSCLRIRASVGSVGPSVGVVEVIFCESSARSSAFGFVSKYQM